VKERTRKVRFYKNPTVKRSESNDAPLSTSTIKRDSAFIHGAEPCRCGRAFDISAKNTLPPDAPNRTRYLEQKKSSFCSVTA